MRAAYHTKTRLGILFIQNDRNVSKTHLIKI